MRLLPLLLLLPGLALAQPPGQTMDPQHFFEQTKQMMLTMIGDSLPAMREAQSCLKGADDQAAFEDCAEIMVALDKKMRARMGAGPGMDQEQAPPMKDPSEIEWNAETKKNMLKFLERSITIGSATQDCLNQSGDMQQMQQCMQARKLNP